MSESALQAIMLTQIIVSLILVVVVLLQNRADGLGGMFGGSGGEVFRTKRGLEKVLYRVTILLSVILCVLSLILVRYGI